LGVKISEGRLEGGVITCRAHGWQYDATSGCGVNPRDAALRSLPIEEREGRLYVDLSGVDVE
jgi:toluene monooxygenase system ferredoxin subunit